jgi:hypothetical protein
MAICAKPRSYASSLAMTYAGNDAMSQMTGEVNWRGAKIYSDKKSAQWGDLQ